jgi:transposase
MPATKRRTFDREFKLNAVNLYKSSGRSIRQLSQELGVPESSYGRWIQVSKADGPEAFPGKGRLRPSDAEWTKLRRALAIACEERDILKKAVGIFSSQRGKNTNL